MYITQHLFYQKGLNYCPQWQIGQWSSKDAGVSDYWYSNNLKINTIVYNYYVAKIIVQPKGIMDGEENSREFSSSSFY